jgi:hypothetical protein
MKLLARGVDWETSREAKQEELSARNTCPPFFFVSLCKILEKTVTNQNMIQEEIKFW